MIMMERTTSDEEAFQDSRTKLMGMLGGFWITQLLHVAANLGIADLLKNGPQSTEQLSIECNAHPQALYRLLRTLASIGVFEEDENSNFRLTPLAKPLVSDVPGSVRPLALWGGSKWSWRTWADLGYSVNTGLPAFEHIYGMGQFDYQAQNPEMDDLFNDVMTVFTYNDQNELNDAYDFAGSETVVDVGGGKGALIAAVLRANPNMRGLLFDLPAVVETAKDALNGYGVADRCQLVAGSFFEEIPTGGDVYILKHIIHDWNDETSIQILKKCREAMKSDSRLLIVERQIPLGNNEGFPAKLFDIAMLIFLHGKERTVSEYQALLTASGLRFTRVIETGSSMDTAIIESVVS